LLLLFVDQLHKLAGIINKCSRAGQGFPNSFAGKVVVRLLAVSLPWSPGDGSCRQRAGLSGFMSLPGGKTRKAHKQGVYFFSQLPFSPAFVPGTRLYPFQHFLFSAFFVAGIIEMKLVSVL
jgi:hypothetical protein